MSYMDNMIGEENKPKQIKALALATMIKNNK